MEIVKQNIEKILSETGYEYKGKYADSQLNRLYNYWCVFQEHEKKLLAVNSMSIEIILYSKYYWFSRLAERFYEVHGFDAGIEQQQFMILEEIDQRVDNADWNFVEKLEAGKVEDGQPQMIIREYQTEDCKELAELFYHTVHTVNAKDYTKEQLAAWATGKVDLEKWNQSFKEHYSVVATWGEMLVGFGDIDKTGYLDRLYVHKDYQRRGIATAICNELERAVAGKIVTHASITARPFFEKRGYKVVNEQQVKREGITLVNFIMEKNRRYSPDLCVH